MARKRLGGGDHIVGKEELWMTHINRVGGELLFGAHFIWTQKRKSRDQVLEAVLGSKFLNKKNHGTTQKSSEHLSRRREISISFLTISPMHHFSLKRGVNVKKTTNFLRDMQLGSIPAHGDRHEAYEWPQLVVRNALQYGGESVGDSHAVQSHTVQEGDCKADPFIGQMKNSWAKSHDLGSVPHLRQRRHLRLVSDACDRTEGDAVTTLAASTPRPRRGASRSSQPRGSIPHKMAQRWSAFA